MSESAEFLAANQTSRRNVTIEITNLTKNFCLIDPKLYLDSGDVHSPPAPTILPTMTKLCNFDKIKGKSTGAVGVLTYDLCERRGGVREKLAVMFSVPFDYNVYENWFALGIYPKDKECDEKLYEEMYKCEEKDEGRAFVRQKSSGCDLTFEGSYLDVKGTMSPMGRAIMKLEVWDKYFSAPMHQQY